ncbi:hypothetical protein [Nonomuraea sp. SYSU D8015]|uniref:hypothetical protein n=1 Tax=Nonomuraea sp. SYSU D8015 TaxID=2593644 RepID=UPI0016617CB3|nr:hypothetical protein [Nonomuraea sp. SYSU D8015]
MTPLSEIYAVSKTFDQARFLRAVPPGTAISRRWSPCPARGRAREGGAGVAVPVPSRCGRSLESVRTGCLGDYHVMLVEGAPGESITPAEPTPAQARLWGAALAGLRLRAGELADVPSSVPGLPRVTTVLPGVSSPARAVWMTYMTWPQATLALLSLLDRVRAADDLVVLREALDVEAAAELPAWLRDLRASLHRRTTGLRLRLGLLPPGR